MPSGFTFTSLISGPNASIALNDYGQVATISRELWTPGTANGVTGTYSLVTAPAASPMQVLMNGRGQVALAESQSVFVWSPSSSNGVTGSAVSIPAPIGALAAMNDFGQLGGYGYLWIPFGANAPTGTLVQDSRFDGLQDLNNYGQAVMVKSGDTGLTVTLFTPSAPRTATGTVTTLQAPSGWKFRSAEIINNNGVILGTVCAESATALPCPSRLFLWRPASPNATTGTFQLVMPAGPITAMFPESMNDASTVVGRMDVNGEPVPFLYNGNGFIYDLTTARMEFARVGRLHINNAGQISAGTTENYRFVSLFTPGGLPATGTVPVTFRSNKDGVPAALLSVVVSGSECESGTYIVPVTLIWNKNAVCTVGVPAPSPISSTTRLVFVEWADGVTTSGRSFHAPAEPATHTISAAFEYLVSPQVYPSGGGTVTQLGWVRESASVTLTATPAAGYRFVQWVPDVSALATVTRPPGSAPTGVIFAPVSAAQYSVVRISEAQTTIGGNGLDDLNDYGQAVGGHAVTVFLWTPTSPNGIAGTSTNLSAMAGFAAPHGVINNRGQVAMRSAEDGRVFLWSPSSPNTAAGSVTAISSTSLPEPVAINDFGQVSGNTYVWTPSAANGASGTLVQNIDWPLVVDINDSGQMLVSSASGWRVFTPSSRGAFTGTYAPVAVAIGAVGVALNNSGHVLGHLPCVPTSPDTAPCTRRAFIANPAAGASATVYIDPPPGFRTVTPTAFNESGHVVGTLDIPASGAQSPFVYRNGSFDYLAAASSALRGGRPGDINNAGQISVTVGQPGISGSRMTSVYLVTPLGGENSGGSATLTLSRPQIQFAALTGTVPTGAQTVQVRLGGTNAASATWSVTANDTWLSVTPTGGTGSGSFQVSINSLLSGGALTGTREGSLTVVATGRASTTIPVIVSFSEASRTRPPFGFLDLPKHNATVSGAVGVTGWALDDIKVEKIEVWRKSVPNEPNLNGQVYIGDGVFIDGARPDVAATYPAVPFNTRAGWGMQVLTNALPNAAGTGPRGNGQHQLFAYAIDSEGKRTLLAAPAIHVDNTNAAKPFGTLDTPPGGGTVSGSQHMVWGWALTPQPAVIPTDGSTVWVFVDGVAVGHPVYNLFRPDVSALFPGLQNSSGPVGYYQLDATKLANGMHSVAWSVTDNLERTEGIGSRVFFVQNNGVNAASAAPALSKGLRSAEREGVWFRTGYNPGAELRKLEGTVIAVEPGGRIELHIPGAASVEFDGSASLPVGSTFDSGVLYWQFDVAYIASYELKFRDAEGGEVGRVGIQVK